MTTINGIRVVGGVLYGFIMTAASGIAAFQNNLGDFFGFGERILAGGVVLAAGAVGLRMILRSVEQTSANYETQNKALQTENAELRVRLNEAYETIEALQDGHDRRQHGKD